MKKLAMLCGVMLTLTIGMNAQSSNEPVEVSGEKTSVKEMEQLTYYKVEQLSVESLKLWAEAEGGTQGYKLAYLCMPSKIIGLNVKQEAKILASLKAFYKEFEKTSLTAEDALQSCAANRRP